MGRGSRIAVIDDVSALKATRVAPVENDQLTATVGTGRVPRVLVGAITNLFRNITIHGVQVVMGFVGPYVRA